MVAFWILVGIIALAIVVAVGILCGRICTEIIRDKNSAMNEVLWFWFGFVFTWIAVLLTIVVKNTKK